MCMLLFVYYLLIEKMLPLTYPVGLDEELVTYILVLQDLYFSVSVSSSQENAKLVI